jgi:hypothetical protein
MERPGVDLPRSVHLAVWLPHLHGSAGQVTRAVTAIEGDDEPHRVVAYDDTEAPGDSLADLLSAWGATMTSIVAVLPVPGDPAGVPPEASVEAVEAGEGVLVAGREGSFIALPEIEEFGSVHEVGHLVTWRLHSVQSWTLGVLGAVGSVADAEGELRTALLTATEALDTLDVAQWHPDAADVISSLRSPVDPAWQLPSEMDARRARVIALAARLRVIVEFATTDSGGAVNLWQADQRAAALRHIDNAARRAMSAATLVMLQP